ncbi:hypothetical protein APHHGE2_1205 [Anaplasma phagocytophilum str. HGE2]|nr:hypothetical protein APHHGE2_1205 [Anaplasma phagocytophilum str. HGE2]
MRASEERFQPKSSLVPVYSNFCEVSETYPLRCDQLFAVVYGVLLRSEVFLRNL